MLQLLWLTLLAVHTGAAAVWWWLMPGGFPSSSTAFWVNQVLPIAVIALLLTALFARGAVSQAILPPVLGAIILFWMAFGISARITFDESFRSLWNLPFFGGAILAALWVKQFRFASRPVWLAPLFMIGGAIAGWSMPSTQRSPDPTTIPAGGSVAEPAGGTTERKIIKLTKDVQVHPDDARVVVRNDKLILNVQPLLTFHDRSPDRCWVGLSPPDRNVATTRKFTSRAHNTLTYKDEDVSVLDVTPAPGGVQIDARSRLSQPVYSHVNAFAELAVQGHHKLSVAFSPVPSTRVPVPSATEPARFAWVDDAGTFHLTQANERQRGPFTEVAAGKLSRKEPLVVTLYDADKPMFVVTVEDWAAQASTQLSPAAGSGIPVNAIEMMRGGDKPDAPALISFTLAGTTIGRGTQSVGHAAGVYRNRLTVKLP